MQRVDILNASSAIEFAEHIAAGSVDAVISDSHIDWSSPFELASAVRRLNPACLYCLFTNEEQQPPDSSCIGYGIDARCTKDSAGFLMLPQTLGKLFQRQANLQNSLRIPNSIPLSEIFPVALFIVTEDGALQATNLVFERILEMPRYRYADTAFEELLVSADDRSRWRRAVASMDTLDDIEAITVMIACGDGLQRCMRCVVKPLHIDGDAVTLWSGVLLDPAMIGAAGERDELPLRVVGADAPALPLGHMLSHDLQQPLQNVLRQAKWLLEHDGGSMSREATDTATHIYNSASRMQEMIDGAVELTRIDGTDVATSAVKLDKVVSEAVDNLKVMIEEAGATVESSHLPAIQGNHSQLVQVFQNLICNAVKFQGERLPRVRISSARQEGYWQIRIEDNGIGIKAADMPRIFDVYKRLHADDEYTGTGVGLAICKRIIESHGGRISVESKPGRGSVFIVEFVAQNSQAA